MAGTTPRGYPYPSEPDQAAGDLNIQALAEAVDADMTANVPAGAIMAWAGAAAPTGWALCNGALLMRSTYSRLFAAIGTQYGEGDGVSTFATPNLEGKVIVAAGGGYALNATGGEATHTLTVAEMPAHTHTGPSHTHSTPAHSHDVVFDNGVNFLRIPANDGSTSNRFILAEGAGEGMKTTNSGSGTSGAGGTGATSSSGSGTAHNNMQPYLVLNYIIKL